MVLLSSIISNIVGVGLKSFSCVTPLFICVNVKKMVTQKFREYFSGKLSSNSYVLRLNSSHYLYKPLVVHFINNYLRVNKLKHNYKMTAIHDYEVVSSKQQISMEYNYVNRSTEISFALYFDFTTDNSCDVYFVDTKTSSSDKLKCSDIFHLMCVNLMLFHNDTVIAKNMYSFIGRFDIENTLIRKEAFVLLFSYFEHRFMEHFNNYKKRVNVLQHEKLKYDINTLCSTYELGPSFRIAQGTTTTTKEFIEHHSKDHALSDIQKQILITSKKMLDTNEQQHKHYHAFLTYMSNIEYVLDDTYKDIYLNRKNFVETMFRYYKRKITDAIYIHSAGITPLRDDVDQLINNILHQIVLVQYHRYIKYDGAKDMWSFDYSPHKSTSKPISAMFKRLIEKMVPIKSTKTGMYYVKSLDV